MARSTRSSRSRQAPPKERPFGGGEGGGNADDRDRPRLRHLGAARLRRFARERRSGGAPPVIDPYQATRFSDCGLQLLKEAGVSGLVEHRAEESQLALPQLLGEARVFDLAFVDGNHRFDGVFVDLVYLGRLVRPGGIVFLDDYQLPSVPRAASFFATNLGWKLE